MPLSPAISSTSTAAPSAGIRASFISPSASGADWASPRARRSMWCGSMQPAAASWWVRARPCADRNFQGGGMAADIDRAGVAKAYERWAPVYDLVFGRVFDHGRQSTIAEADRIGGRILAVGGG